MTAIEDRLRAAAAAAASTVAEGSAPPLNLPTTHFRPLPRQRRLLTWAAPVTAALSLVAAVIAATVLHGLVSGPGTPNWGQASVALPRYFVALSYVGQFQSWKIRRTNVVVGNTATGRPIIKITPPEPYDAFVQVTAAANGTEYVVAAQNLTRQLPYYTETGFYEVKITSKNSSVTAELSPLPIPVLSHRTFTVTDGIALSPDGTRLAVTQGSSAEPAVHVYDMTSGRQRSWSLPASAVGAGPAIRTPSWEANGRYLAIDVSSRDPAGGQCLDCIRLLDTATPGGDILSDSRLLVRSPNLHVSAYWNSALIAPDGSSVLRSAIVHVPVTKNSFYDRPWIYDYDARSGALVRSMTGTRGIDWTLLWSSQDGKSFIVSSVGEGAGTGFVTAARFTNDRWHPVPLPAQSLAAAW